MDDDRPSNDIPWRRVLRLVAPFWRGLAAMTALSVLGSLLGLVAPIALGFLVNGLAAGHPHREAIEWGLAVAAAIVGEGAAYIFSDGLYARNASRLHREVRLRMLDGVLRRPPRDDEQADGLSARFVSDAETIEQLTVALLDVGAMRVVEVGAALVALGALDPWSVVVTVGLIAVGVLVSRVTQRPAAAAGHKRQEALEQMSGTLARVLAERDDPAHGRRRFEAAASRLLATELRLGWLSAANRHGSAALAALGPIAVVVASAFQGSYRAGTLLSLFLLAERAFAGADSLLDLRLDVQIVSGAVGRCFELIDGRGSPAAEAVG